MKVEDRIIVALDYDSAAESLNLVKLLKGKVGFFKVGSQLFSAEGPPIIKKIIEMGEKVFLDLKFHDIPNTAAKSAQVAQKMGVSMLTIHTSGGFSMMSAVMSALSSSKPSINRPLVLGVTVLTSLGTPDLQKLGIQDTLSNQVVRLGSLAIEAGLDGLVAAPTEVSLIRRHFGSSLLLVTPGIRPSGSPLNDQNRVATAGASIEAGSDHLVIGRPITASSNPVFALEELLTTIKNTNG